MSFCRSRFGKTPFTTGENVNCSYCLLLSDLNAEVRNTSVDVQTVLVESVNANIQCFLNIVDTFVLFLYVMYGLFE